MSDTAKNFQLVEDFMRLLAAGIDGSIKDAFGPKGFALVMFDFGKPDIGNYISNVKREDMIVALREAANRIEERQVVPAGVSSTAIH